MIINDVEFHDLPVRGIEFSLATQEVIISCEKYDEENKAYSPIKLYFNLVKNMCIDLMEIANPNDIEVSSFDIQDSDGIRKAKFEFLTGFSKPNMNLSFEFQNVHYSW